MEKSFLICALILYSTHCFSVSRNLKETGASITPEMLTQIKDTCSIAYAFFNDDLWSNAKYISSALRIQGL